MAGGKYPVVTSTESFADMFNVLGSLFLRYKDSANARAVEAERLGLERARVAIQRDQANWNRMNAFRQNQIEREKLALSGRQIDIAGMQAMGEEVDRAEAAATRSEKLIENSTAKYKEKSIAFATSQGAADSKAYIQSKEGAPQLVEALAEKYWRFTKHDGTATLGHTIWNSSVSDNRKLYGSQWGMMQAFEGNLIRYMTMLEKGKTVKIVDSSGKSLMVIPGKPGGPTELDVDQLVRGVGAQMSHTSNSRKKIMNTKYGTASIRHYLSPLFDEHSRLASAVGTGLQRNAEYDATLGVYFRSRSGEFKLDDQKRKLSAYNDELIKAKRLWGVNEPLESLLYQDSVGQRKQKAITGTDDYGRPFGPTKEAAKEMERAATQLGEEGEEVLEGPGYGEPTERSQAMIWDPFSGFHSQELGGFGVSAKERTAWNKAYGLQSELFGAFPLVSSDSYKAFGRFWKDIFKYTVGGDAEAFDKTLLKFGAGAEDQKAIANSLISDFGPDGSLLNRVFGIEPILKKTAGEKETKLREAMRQDLFNDEGLRLHQYDDATGNPISPGSTKVGKATIGYGRCLETNPLNTEEAKEFKARYPDVEWNEHGPVEMSEDFAKYLRDRDISTVIGGGEKNFNNFWDLELGRQLGLGNMMYNMGVDGVAGLDSLVPAVEQGDFGQAAGIVDKQQWWENIVGPDRKDTQVRRILYGEE